MKDLIINDKRNIEIANIIEEKIDKTIIKTFMMLSICLLTSLNGSLTLKL